MSVSAAGARSDDELPAPTRCTLDRLLPQLVGTELVVDRLAGGARATTYRVRVLGPAGPDLVVRVVPPGTSDTDPAGQWQRMQVLAAAGVGAEPVVADVDAGVLVSRHLTGRALTAGDLAAPAVRDRVAAALRTLQAGPAFPARFDLATVRSAYAEAAAGLPLPAGHQAAAPQVDALAQALAGHPLPLVPGHGDLQPGNLIDDGDRVWLVDAEYAAQHDPGFDLGTLTVEAGLTPEAVVELVRIVLGEATPARVARVSAWAVVSAHTWVPWALVQAHRAADPAEAEGWHRWVAQRLAWVEGQLVEGAGMRWLRALAADG